MGNFLHACITRASQLTPKQQEALRALASEPQASWAFGSTTVNRLRLHGLAVTNAERKLEITDLGRAVLRS